MNTLLLTGLIVTMVTLFTTAQGQASAFAGNLNFPGFPGFQNMFHNFFPIPRIVFSKNWWEGKNVCVTQEEVPLDGPDRFAEFGDGGRESSETCKGDLYKYVCVIQTRDNGVTKQIVKTYQCCEGFTRPNDLSPGCVESEQGQNGGQREFDP